jgi:periplasmic copper chaperone A
LYCLAFCLAMVVAHTGQAFAQQSKSGDLVIENAWSRATPPGARIGAGYHVIKNRGTVADWLIGGTSDVSRIVEIRATTVKDGMMTMEHMAGGLLIEPGRGVTLMPGGSHIIFVNLHAPLELGDTFQATLEFENAGKVDVTFQIDPVGAPTRATSRM